ncbi:MAG TPA: DUF1801 domain-containing protein [Steroidobacteraceae bacterium]
MSSGNGANVQELLATLEPEVRSLALAVRKLVRAVLPRVQEITDAGTRVIGYGYGPGYRDMVATILLSRAGVKLGLVRGAELPDPRHLLEGRGKVHRHIAFTELQQVSRPGVKALLKAAYAAWLERRAVR